MTSHSDSLPNGCFPPSLRRWTRNSKYSPILAIIWPVGSHFIFRSMFYYINLTKLFLRKVAYYLYDCYWSKAIRTCIPKSGKKPCIIYTVYTVNADLIPKYHAFEIELILDMFIACMVLVSDCICGSNPIPRPLTRFKCWTLDKFLIWFLENKEQLSKLKSIIKIQLLLTSKKGEFSFLFNFVTFYGSNTKGYFEYNKLERDVKAETREDQCLSDQMQHSAYVICGLFICEWK